MMKKVVSVGVAALLFVALGIAEIVLAQDMKGVQAPDRPDVREIQPPARPEIQVPIIQAQDMKGVQAPARPEEDRTTRPGEHA